MQPYSLTAPYADRILRLVLQRRRRLAQWARVGVQFRMPHPDALLFTVTRVTPTMIYFRALEVDRPQDRDRRLRKVDLLATIRRHRLRRVRGSGTVHHDGGTGNRERSPGLHGSGK